jgi:hypothetical protein
MKIFVSKKIILGGLLAIVMAFSWASFSLAAPLAGNNNIVFENPLQHDTVDTLLAALLGRLQGIIVVISMVFIVIGGLIYITSAGNESRMTMAKGAISAAVIGLAVGVAAPRGWELEVGSWELGPHLPCSSHRERKGEAWEEGRCVV